MSRLPIRVRLTVPFAVAMAVVLAALGVFVYLRIGRQLLASIDGNLRAQVEEVRTNATERHALVDQDATDGPTIAAVELPSGQKVSSTPAGLGRIPVPTRLRGPVLSTRVVPGLRGSWRIIEAPADLAGRHVVVVVGRSLGPRDETLDRLAREFLVAGPAALLLAVLAGYGLAAAALRPVEAMRRRAAAVSADAPGHRLPVPVARDELRALALTLNEMLARLEASFEHERRFVSDASHELRTPLALLRAELELALRRPRGRAELEAALRSAAEETERLSRLAEDLLLLARADQGRLPVRLERVAVRPLLERVGERFAVHAEATGRMIEVGMASAYVEADPVRVEQALGNLVDNALRHGAGPVVLAERALDGVVELHVTDEGAGVPDGFAGRAFDRFSRADDARGEGGSGLGLSIVSLIAEAHGGSASLRARDGGGTDAWIALRRSS